MEKDSYAISGIKKAYIISITADDLNKTFIKHGIKNVEEGILGIANAMCASPSWALIKDAIIVARIHVDPVLGVIGSFEKKEMRQFEVLQLKLNGFLHRLKYINYSQAEDDCEMLASRLLDAFGRAEIKKFIFAGIPRGGLIVLGMLSYMLDLDHSQLTPSYDLNTPLVVVDDCVMSGRRFWGYLKQCKHNTIVFSHLYSHPKLREKIADSEPRVISCISARDIVDYPSKKSQWHEGPEGKQYWLGKTEYICFPWNEPDSTFYNPISGQVESGFRFMPPELCIKNRLADRSRYDRLQIQDEGKGPLKPSLNIIYGILGSEIVVVDIEKNKSFSLDGMSAKIWKAIIKFGNVPDILETLLKKYNVNKKKLETDVNTFVNDLVRRGILVTE